MKKFFSLLVLLAFLSTSSTLAATEPEQATELVQTPSEPKEVKAAPKEVGKASNEGVRAAKRRDWQNWLFAGTSVAIAIAALLLLRDSGHAPHHNN